MSVWQNFENVDVEEHDNDISRPRMSMTSDVLGYRRCRRQYGYFNQDGYVPTQTTQIFYGQVIHQVLDRAHRHYQGLFPEVDEGDIPTDDEIEEYFQEVQNALITHGIRPKSGQSRDQALEVLKRFNRLEGEELYPRVWDTEYQLETSREDYILHGVVDVIANTDSGDPGEREIWDYKGASRPEETSEELQNYKWQMSVYAELYHQRTGQYPDRAVLYFMNELEGGPPPTQRPVGAIYSVDFTDDEIDEGLQEFDSTVDEILHYKDRQEWPAPDEHNLPPEETCDVCDIRFDCPAREGSYPLRYPATET
jgi:putative RecB family exonuclease